MVGENGFVLATSPAEAQTETGNQRSDSSSPNQRLNPLTLSNENFQDLQRLASENQQENLTEMPQQTGFLVPASKSFVPDSPRDYTALNALPEFSLPTPRAQGGYDMVSRGDPGLLSVLGQRSYAEGAAQQLAQVAAGHDLAENPTDLNMLLPEVRTLLESAHILLGDVGDRQSDL